MVIGLLLIGSLLLSNSTQFLALVAPRQRRALSREAGKSGDPKISLASKRHWRNRHEVFEARIAHDTDGTVAFTLPALGRQNAPSEPVAVGLLPKLDTDPYFQVAKGGAEDAAKEIGGKVIQAAPSQATAEAQIEFINNLVTQKVGVIAIAGNDANAVAPALKRAAKEGIRVISYDSDVATDARQVFVNQVKGDSLAEMMLETPCMI